MKKIIILLLVIMIGVVVISCKKSDSSATGEQKIVTAKMQETDTNLYYLGMIKPLQVEAVTAPADGTVLAMNFVYGHEVKAKQKLLEIDSAKLEKDYRTALTNFLKAKNQYEQAQASFIGTKQLWKAGIIDDENYEKDKSTLATNELSYINSQKNLTQAAESTPGASQAFADLSLDDVTAIKRILAKDIEHLVINAPISGIALFPEKSTGDDGSKKIHTGSEVKRGQVLVTIGNLSGLSVVINVDAAHVNEVKPKDKVNVTLPSLADVKLSGYVKAVAAQATAEQGGNSNGVTFEVNVVVPKLSERQQKIIHVGMDAKVEIKIKNPPTIIVPIKAIQQQKGQTVVTVLDNGQKKTVPVQTGRTTLSGVAITSGLKAGDKVIVND